MCVGSRRSFDVGCNALTPKTACGLVPCNALTPKTTCGLVPCGHYSFSWFESRRVVLSVTDDGSRSVVSRQSPRCGAMKS